MWSSSGPPLQYFLGKIRATLLTHYWEVNMVTNMPGSNKTIKHTWRVQSISDTVHKNSPSLSAMPCCQYRHIIYSLINRLFAVSTTDLLTWSALIFSCRILLFDLVWLRPLCSCTADTRSSRLVSLAVWMLRCTLAWCRTHTSRNIWGQRTMCSAALIWRIP